MNLRHKTRAGTEKSCTSSKQHLPPSNFLMAKNILKLPGLMDDLGKGRQIILTGFQKTNLPSWVWLGWS